MKAMVLEKERKLTYTDVPEPLPVGRDPVAVRIGAVGVCGSDILRFAKGKAYHYPLILGHEFSAVVDETSPSGAFTPGDRVAVFPLIPDPDDPYSLIGEYAVSSGYDYFGSRRDGAFAERLYVPERNLIRVPRDFSLLHAACVEPAAVALHAMLKLSVPSDAVGLVIGAGPIGAFAAQWLRILGCTRVLVADIDARKRDVMQSLGFEVIDARAGDTVDAVKKLTEGRGVDLSVEASGIPDTFVQAIDVAATFGQVMLLGDLSGDVTLEAQRVSSILRRELRLYGTWNSKIVPAGRSEWDMVANHMIAGTLQVAPLISHTPTLDQGPEMFSKMAERSVWYNKVVFALSEEARAEITTRS
jgi:L-iditol 2-dehydrogenase